MRITHRRGSLEAATETARRRNLYVSSGALFLIGVAFALVLVSARRARALAAQQVDFVAGVSHELNTPLQAIRSAGENLSAGIVREPADVRGYGELIDREGRRLLRLVEHVLEWAGIGRRPTPVQTEQLDAGALLRTVIAESNWFLEEHGVELDVSGLDDLPAIQGDRDALNLALANILHNAAKYGADEDGSVRVRVEAGCDEGRQRVTVRVTDGGPGIPAPERQRIFEPFVRGRRATEGTIPGSGLGLSLARKTIEGQGYDVAIATDGPSGERMATEGGFDLVLLDISLPRKNGFDVCRDLRQQGVTTPILTLTAYDATPTTRTVDVHVSSLRQKVEPNPGRPEFIVTVHGLGYRFDG